MLSSDAVGWVVFLKLTDEASVVRGRIQLTGDRDGFGLVVVADEAAKLFVS